MDSKYGGDNCMKIKKVIYWLLIILFLPITIWFILFKLIWKCRWNKFIKVIASIGVVVIGLIVCSNIGDSEKQITENTYNQTSTSDSLAEVEETTQKITTTTTKQTSITSSTTTQTTTSSTTITTTTTRTTNNIINVKLGRS